MAQYDTDKAINFINRKWHGRPCPMCGHDKWSLQDSAFQLMEFHEGAIHVGGPVYPVLAVMCRNCGNTVLVNAIVAGVVGSEQNQDEKEKSAQRVDSEAGEDDGGIREGGPE